MPPQGAVMALGRGPWAASPGRDTQQKKCYAATAAIAAVAAIAASAAGLLGLA